ncbi:MAG: sorbosone dehydrogenase [Alphaproteobacteria bacterium]|nr:MAG: sorbosone dehydrogenase [Alphaproteobacteria bacterium]
MAANAGLSLPAGFKATVFADGVGRARHMAVSPSGWVYAALMRPVKGFGAVAYHDDDGDGVADSSHYFAKGMRGTGMAIHNGHLYFSTDVSVIRWALPESGEPVSDPELIAHGFPQQRQHASKPFAFDDNGGLYVNVGAPSNSCMERMRQKGSPGMDPCPILEEFAGVWRFDADTPMQERKDATLYVTGVRNAMALDWNPYAGSLYLLQHGRDQLAEFFPEFYTVEDSAELPAEEFHKVAEGANVGWPYSYYDQRQHKRMQMPEYGGDGKKPAEREGQEPLIGFPGHWAPNDLLFRRTGTWPAHYRTGAFIAFHGSWNRAPEPQQGYRVVYVPMDAEGNITGDWETFANGFAGPGPIMSPRDAENRPTGLAEGPDGALYISSMQNDGRIYRVTYAGQ